MNLEITSPHSSFYELELFNSNGQQFQIKSSNLNRGKNNIIINMENFPSGVYFYRLKINDEIKTGRILKIQ